MNTKTAFYTFNGDKNEVSKYSNNKNACGALFYSMDTNKVYIMNAMNEVIEIVNSYSSLDTLKEIQAYIEKSENHPRPTNCKNCGAVLTSYKCEYCGTEY